MAFPVLLIGLGVAALVIAGGGKKTAAPTGRKKRTPISGSPPVACEDPTYAAGSTYAETYKGVHLYTGKKINGNDTGHFFAFMCLSGHGMMIGEDGQSFDGALQKARLAIDELKRQGAL